MNRFEYKARKLEHLERLLDMNARELKDPAYQEQSRMALLVGAVLLSAIGGAVLVGLSLQKTRTETSGHLWWKDTATTNVSSETRTAYLVFGIVLLLIAVVFIVASIRRFTRRRALKKYLAILTGVEVMKIDQISYITNLNKSRVYQDIQTMIDSGMIDDFYVDYQGEQVVSKKYIPKTSHKTVVTCTGCGGNNELIVGITRPCRFCGEPLVLASP